jgi:hypothetical protein
MDVVSGNGALREGGESQGAREGNSQFFQATSFNSELKIRIVKDNFTGECPFAYHLGLGNLECIEVQRVGDEFFFLFWSDEGTLLRDRKLSAREVESLSDAYAHLDGYFRSIDGALELSEKVHEHGRCDAKALADSLRFLLKIHDEHLRSLPISRKMAFDQRGLLLSRLIDGVEDIFEMSFIGEALARSLRRALPASQGVKRGEL